MWCPRCGEKTDVKDTLWKGNDFHNSSILRRILKTQENTVARKRVCRVCKHTIFTIEAVIEPPMPTQHAQTSPFYKRSRIQRWANGKYSGK